MATGWSPRESLFVHKHSNALEETIGLHRSSMCRWPETLHTSTARTVPTGVNVLPFLVALLLSSARKQELAQLLSTDPNESRLCPSDSWSNLTFFCISSSQHSRRACALATTLFWHIQCTQHHRGSTFSWALSTILQLGPMHIGNSIILAQSVHTAPQGLSPLADPGGNCKHDPKRPRQRARGKTPRAHTS